MITVLVLSFKITSLLSISLQTAQNRASILFFDRALDLASPASYNSETLLDKLQQLLPRLQGHKTDVRVNMAPLCKVHRYAIAITTQRSRQLGHMSLVVRKPVFGVPDQV